MSEPVPAAIITTLILLLTAISFFTLLSIWSQHGAAMNRAAALQEHRLETSLDILQVELSPDACPNYGGPFQALVSNSGATSFTPLEHMDVFVQYSDAADGTVARRLQHETEWQVSSLSPDNRNPNQWDPAETGALDFSLDPKLKPESQGVVVIAAPQGITHSSYFTCPIECSGVTGFHNPTAEAADGGDGFENNPQHAFQDDGNAASSQELLGGTQNSHRYFNYGFSIHPSCEIQGIEVRLDWWLLTTLGTNSMSVDLSWDGGNSWTATKADTTETTSPHTAILGGDSDTWGRVWSPGELSNANFRVRVHTHRTVSQTFFLGWVPVNVYFAPP